MDFASFIEYNKQDILNCARFDRICKLFENMHPFLSRTSDLRHIYGVQILILLKYIYAGISSRNDPIVYKDGGSTSIGGVFVQVKNILVGKNIDKIETKYDTIYLDDDKFSTDVVMKSRESFLEFLDTVKMYLCKKHNIKVSDFDERIEASKTQIFDGFSKIY